VVEVGPGVTSLQPGDDVALEPGIPCWFNRASREGRYNIDPDIKFFATPPVHGSLAEVAHRSSLVLARGAAPLRSVRRTLARLCKAGQQRLLTAPRPQA
jgi:D-arabinose 1-dehydrogenase-like Zn-dependent alcohol dehydrogenase